MKKCKTKDVSTQEDINMAGDAKIWVSQVKTIQVIPPRSNDAGRKGNWVVISGRMTAMIPHSGCEHLPMLEEVILAMPNDTIECEECHEPCH